MGTAQEVAKPQPSIIIEYKNQRPIELLDLTASLAAFGEQFKNYVAERGNTISVPRLFVHEMRQGSIVAELIPWLEQIDFITKHRGEIAGFMVNWEDILRGILNLTDRSRELGKATLRNARSFVSATAKDSGSQLNIVAQDRAVQNVTINNIVIRSGEAEMISRNAGHLLARSIPTEEPFTNEPMKLYQMRDARGGDMGFIDRFSEKPVRLTFASEELKNSIMHHSENPWDTLFFVSGVVKTARGNIAAYHVRCLDGVAPRDVA